MDRSVRSTPRCAPRSALASLSLVALVGFWSTAALAQTSDAGDDAPASDAGADTGASGGDAGTDQQGTPNEVTPPRLIRAVNPEYPESQRASGRSATVQLVLTLDDTGKVVDAEVSASAGPEFDAAALAAAKQLEFEPARRGGQAMAAKIPFRFEFKLEPKPVPEPAEPAAKPGAAKPAPKPAAPAPTAAPDGEDSMEVDVEGTKPPAEPTRHEISAEEVRTLPGTNGDALRAVNNMPGVARPPGLAGLLIVRGSAPQDTAVYVDGTPVPIAYHFGGVSSVIPTEVLDHLDFYPGNFGPQYGMGMGGVVDIGLKSPRSDRLGGLLELDLLDARVVAEGPVSKHTRVLVAGRRSWVDTWLGPMMRSMGLGVSVAPVYYDAQAIIEHDLTPDTTLRVAAFGSDDRLALTVNSPAANDPAAGGTLSSETGFWTIQGRAKTRLSPNLTWTNTVSYGKMAQRFTIGAMGLHWTAYQPRLRSEVRATFGAALATTVGVDMSAADYDVWLRLPVMDYASGDTYGPSYGRPLNEVHGSGWVYRPGAYLTFDIRPLDGLTLIPGVRADYTSETDSWTIDPRFTARYDVVKTPLRTTLKGGVGIYHQPPEPWQGVEPFGTVGIRNNRAIHYSLGVEQELRRGVEVSLEGFYKHLDDLVVQRNAATSTQSGMAFDNAGSGRTYGAELLARYNPDGRFFGWIAYTLSRSERRDGPDEPLHLFQYDQTHIFTVLGSYELGRGWKVGARWRYVSGNLYTPYIGGVMDYGSGSYAPISGAPYSKRLPAFHQLDVRVDKTWKFASWQLGVYLDLQNAYNRQNPEAPSYNFDYSKSDVLPGLPILPVLGIRGEI